MTEIETLRREIERRLITVAPSRQFVLSVMEDVDRYVGLQRKDAVKPGHIEIAEECGL